MEVNIILNKEVIWMRDNVNLKGITSMSYLKDGTQQEIIAALEDALFQAKGQAGLSENID